MSPIDQYFDAVKTGRNRWWHWLLGLGTIIAIPLSAAYLLALTLRELIPAAWLENSETLEFILLGFLFLTFLPIFFGVWAVQKFWHKRSLTSLLTYSQKFRWRYFWNAGFAVLVVYGLTGLIEYLVWPENFDEVTLNSSPKAVLIGGALVFLLVPFQAASEEFLIRGYLNQGLSKYINSPWPVFVLTSALFAGLHYWNPEATGQEFPYLLAIFSFGIAACILLFIEGGLESAIGFHVVNNIYAFSLFGYEDPDLPEVAILSTGIPEINLQTTLIDMVWVGCVVGLTLWLNRRYQRRAQLSNPITS